MIRALHTTIACCISFAVSAQTYRSPFNDLEVHIPDTVTAYTFLVGGHFYGGSGSGGSGLPASTLLAGIPRINGTKADFLVSTGDMFIDAVADRPRYEEAFFQRLDMPLLNAVGNHDVDNKQYEQVYGATYYSLNLGVQS